MAACNADDDCRSGYRCQRPDPPECTMSTADGGTLKVPGVVPKLSATPGDFDGGGPRLGEHTDEVLRELGYGDAAIADLQAGHIDEAKLSRIKSNQRYSLILELEDPESVAEQLAWTISVTGELDAVDRYMAALDALTPADVAAFARERLVPAGRTIVTLTQGTPEVKK